MSNCFESAGGWLTASQLRYAICDIQIFQIQTYLRASFTIYLYFLQKCGPVINCKPIAIFKYFKNVAPGLVHLHTLLGLYLLILTDNIVSVIFTRIGILRYRAVQFKIWRFQFLFWFSINIGSFQANFHKFFAYLSQIKTKPKIIVLNETWFLPENCQNLDSYQAFHVTRPNGKGGGVSMYVLDNI